MNIILNQTNLYDTNIPKLFNSRREALNGLFSNSRSAKKCNVTICNKRAKMVAKYMDNYILVCDKCYYLCSNIEEFSNELVKIN